MDSPISLSSESVVGYDHLSHVSSDALADMELAITEAKLNDDGDNSTSSSNNKGNNNKTPPSGGAKKENTGRWQTEEHEIFLKGLNEHGKQWKKIAVMIQTRSVVQVRTHAQKYFQKLLKNENNQKPPGKEERSYSILSTSTAASTTSPLSVKRKSSNKSNSSKKRRVSLEPKPKNASKWPHMVPPPPLMASAPPMPPPPPSVSPAEEAIDSSFMNTLAEGELDDTLLDCLLDDSSVEAVEQMCEDDDDLLDLEPNKVETCVVSPSVSSASLAEQRQEIVTSPTPQGMYATVTVSPTSVAMVMDAQDFEQKTSGYYHQQEADEDALDWLMDVGVHRLPATANEAEEWNASATTLLVPLVPKLSISAPPQEVI